MRVCGTLSHLSVVPSTIHASVFDGPWAAIDVDTFLRPDIAPHARTVVIAFLVVSVFARSNQGVPR